MTPWTDAFSSALLHFVWQGLAVGSLLWTALWLMRECSANARYLASCIALVVQASLPVLTAVLLYSNPPLRQAAGTAYVPARIAIIRADTAIDWQHWAVPLWFAGVLIFAIRLGWGYRQVAALRQRGIAADAGLRTMVAGLAERMGLSRSVQVLTASLPGGPSVIGWIRPAILIPAATVAGLTPEQLEMVLAHELAHIRRFDYLVNLGQMLIETLLFYHPAVWWVSARIRQERELCCDVSAVRVCGNPICYARALTALEKLRSGEPLVGMGAASRPLLYRIQRLTGTGTPDNSGWWAAVLAISATLACLAFNVGPARGQAQVPPAPSRSLPAPQAPTVRKARPTRKPIQTPAEKPPEENPWISQIVVSQPEPPKVDPLPPELSLALKSAAYAAGWEFGYHVAVHGDDGTDPFARSADISRDLYRLEKEAAGADSAVTREKIFAELRALADELNKINEQLRAARHAEGDLRDPPADGRGLLPGN